MKILHIWNTAGVASVIAEYMDKIYGTQSWVVMRKKFGPFSFTTYGAFWNCSGKVFTLKALWKARKYDIIHVHGFDRIIPLLRILYPKKPIVLHYHGTDIRHRREERRKFWRYADVVIVATPGLLETLPDAVYIPNPVNTNLFYPTKITHPKTASHIHYFADDLAKEYAQKYGLKLVIYNRDIHPIPHAKFGEALGSYEYYIDVKRLYPLLEVNPGISKTGLEALACGCKVINGKGSIVKGLPLEHKPENCIKKLYKIYSDLI